MHYETSLFFRIYRTEEEKSALEGKRENGGPVSNLVALFFPWSG